MDQKQKLKSQFRNTVFTIKTEYGFSSFYEITKSYNIPNDILDIYFCGAIDEDRVNPYSFLYMDRLTNKLDYMSIDELYNAVDVANVIFRKLKRCFSKLERK